MKTNLVISLLTVVCLSSSLICSEGLEIVDELIEDEIALKSAAGIMLKYERMVVVPPKTEEEAVDILSKEFDDYIINHELSEGSLNYSFDEYAEDREKYIQFNKVHLLSGSMRTIIEEFYIESTKKTRIFLNDAGKMIMRQVFHADGKVVAEDFSPVLFGNASEPRLSEAHADPDAFYNSLVFNWMVAYDMIKKKPMNYTTVSEAVHEGEVDEFVTISQIDDEAMENEPRSDFRVVRLNGNLLFDSMVFKTKEYTKDIIIKDYVSVKGIHFPEEIHIVYSPSLQSENPPPLGSRYPNHIITLLEASEYSPVD